MEEIDELWKILNSDEPETNRLELAKEWVVDWAEDNNHDLPEIREYDFGDDDEDDNVEDDI